MSRGQRLGGVALLTLALAACEGPVTMPVLKERAIKARDEARAARDSASPRTAARAARRAGEAEEKARELAGRETATAEDKAVVVEIHAAAWNASLASEEAEFQSRLSGFKAGLHRKARDLALSLVFEAFAAGADQAAKAGGVDSLPEPMRESALDAARVVQDLSGRGPRPDGTTDWTAVAADARALHKHPSVRLTLLVGLAMAAGGPGDGALVDVHDIKPEEIADPQLLIVFHLVKGVVYRTNGFPHLAIEEFRKVDATRPEALGEQAQAISHLIVAVAFILEKDYRQADVEIVKAMKVWPDNPLGVFLTGERLGAEGQYEQAAESLEKLAAESGLEWLAGALAGRAKKLRDHKGPVDPLIADPAFLQEVMMHYVLWAYRKTEAGQAVARQVDAVKGLGRKVLAQIPGAGK